MAAVRNIDLAWPFDLYLLILNRVREEAREKYSIPVLFLVASNVTQSDIAFCILYSFGYRLTWAVLPWTIVALSWLTVLPRFRRLQV